jgi:hypothetical protein
MSSVTVTVDDGQVEIDIELFGLAEEIKQDYTAQHTPAEIEEDAAAIREALAASPLNFTMHHTMSK